jgi:hypothetical protein
LENTGTDRAISEAIAYGYSSSGRILFIQEAGNLVLWIDAGVSVVARFFLREHDDVYGILRSIKIEVSWENGKSPNEKTFRFE